MINRLKRVLNNLNLNSGEQCKSKPRQLVEIIYLALRYRLAPIEYRTYRFFNKDKKMPEMSTYISNHEILNKIRPRLYDRTLLPMLTNKLIFNRYYKASGLPLPHLYAYYHSGSGFTAENDLLRSGKDLRQWLARTGLNCFFIKPCGGKKGSDVLAIKQVTKYNGDYLLSDSSGSSRYLGELTTHLEQESKESTYPGYLFEEMIEQHPTLSEINQSSVNTCRILTLILPNNTINIPFAVMRFGREGSAVDSWSRGGIAFAVDLETGKLGKGLFHPDWGSTKEVTRHPDSEVELSGLKIPYWNEIKEVVRNAALVTPGIKSIGWDVAVTQKGPLLIEGNSLWSPLIFQAIYGGFLSAENRELFNQAGAAWR